MVIVTDGMEPGWHSDLGNVIVPAYHRGRQWVTNFHCVSVCSADTGMLETGVLLVILCSGHQVTLSGVVNQAPAETVVCHWVTSSCGLAILTFSALEIVILEQEIVIIYEKQETLRICVVTLRNVVVILT